MIPIIKSYKKYVGNKCPIFFKPTSASSFSSILSSMLLTVFKDATIAPWLNVNVKIVIIKETIPPTTPSKSVDTAEKIAWIIPIYKRTLNNLSWFTSNSFAFLLMS